MDSLHEPKRLRLRRPDRCMVCDCELPPGQEAVWHRDLRRVSCLLCSPAEASVAGEAGASALREYERRRQRREQHARETLGGVGVFLARAIDEPASTKTWKQGGEGEVRTASRLEKHLAGTGAHPPGSSPHPATNTGFPERGRCSPGATCAAG